MRAGLRTGAVAAVTAAALAIRAPLTFGSGIWADEGMALNVVAIPSLAGMLDFLRFHESHPPFFYILMRGWRAVAGTDDAAALGLMLFLSVLLVPVTYVIARSFMSVRASAIATVLVAVSPALAEHSSQLRPYGLMHLLVLISCYQLVAAVEHGQARRWLAYVVATVLMLYTHNWAWLIFGGQVLACAYTLLASPLARRTHAARDAAFAFFSLVLLYVPWFPALLFQSAHTGHTGLDLESAWEILGFGLFALVSIPDFFLLGIYPKSSMPIVLTAGAVAGSIALLTALVPGATLRFHRQQRGDVAENEGQSNAIRMFLITMVVAVAGAVVLSPWSTLFIQRCVAMLTPLLLLCVGFAIDRGLGRTEKRFRQLSMVLFGFLLSLEMSALYRIMSTPRSNSREVAAAVRASVRADDLLITAPEWFAPSFNHYFPATIEQRDHPQSGRTGPIDFAGSQRRSLDSAASKGLARAILAARNSGRRVWLISERTYLRYADDVLPTLTSEKELARYAPVRRASEARDLLVKAYGPPDTAHFVRGRVSRYEELLPLLFEVPPSSPR